MPNNALSKVAAAGGAACVFAGGMIGLPTNFLGDLLISTPLALGAGSAIWYFWPGRLATKEDLGALRKQMDDLASQGHAGIDPREVVEAIRTGSDKLDRILMESTAIRAPNTIRRIKQIDKIGRKIIEDFRVDPKDVRLAQNWLNSYLDETIGLVKGYAQLSRAGARNIEAQEKMAQFDETLDQIEKGFQDLLDKLLANDILDFDVNQTVMNARLSNEGIA